MGSIDGASPVDFYNVVLANLSTIVMALPQARLVAFFNTLLAVHVSARKDHLVFVLIASAALHLGQPIVEL